MQEDALRTALDRSPLFAESTAELPFVLCAFPEDTPLTDIRDGEPQIGLVVRGHVAVYSASPDGRDVRVTSLEPGDCFGIANLFGQEPLQTRLRTEGETQIAYLPKTVLIRHLEQDGAMALRYIRLLDDKVQFLLRRIELLTTQNHQARLIAWLLSHTDDEIRFPGKREALAAHLGMSRAALFRELADLDGRGLVGTKGTLLRILNREGLEQLLYEAPGRSETSPSQVL